MKEKSFRFRENFGKAIMPMTDKQAGQLVKGLCIYAFNGKPIESKDSTVQSSFMLMKTAIEQDERDRENGRKGGLISAEQGKKRKQLNADALDEFIIKCVVSEVLDGLTVEYPDEKDRPKSEDKSIAKD